MVRKRRRTWAAENLVEEVEDPLTTTRKTTQNKLLVMVAKDVETRTYAAICLREQGAREYATSQLVSLLRRLGYRNAMLQSDGEPSVVVLKIATLLTSLVVEHATNSVAESAMRQVTRTRKIAFEADCGRDR